MISITKKQILEKWDNLPETLKEALFSDEIETIILKICHNHNLNNQQIEIIGLAISDVLLGFLTPSLLSQQLEKDGFSSDLTTLIFKEINEKVFAPLIKELTQVYGNTTITSQISPISEKQETDVQFKKNEDEGPVVVVAPEILPPYFNKTEESAATATNATAATAMPEAISQSFAEELTQDYINKTSTSQISPISEKQEADIQLKKNETERFVATVAPEILSPSFKEKQSSSLPKIVNYSNLLTPIEPTFAEKPLHPSPLLNSSETQINSSNIIDLKEIPIEQSTATNKEISSPNF